MGVLFREDDLKTEFLKIDKEFNANVGAQVVKTINAACAELRITGDSPEFFLAFYCRNCGTLLDPEMYSSPVFTGLFCSEECLFAQAGKTKSRQRMDRALLDLWMALDNYFRFTLIVNKLAYFIARWSRR